MLSRKKWVAVINGNRWVMAKISRRKDKLTIHRLAEFNSSAESIPEENEIDSSESVPHSDIDRQAFVLKTWLRKNKVPLKKLEIALCCPGVITRMITLPQLSEKDLEKLLTEQVDQYFTLNITDYVVDYRILEKIKEEGQERLRVLLVAIPLTQWENHWQLWERIGVNPKVTDFSADCLTRFYSQLCALGEDNNQDPLDDIAIVDLGPDRIEIVLLEHGVFFLYSDLGNSLDGLEFPKGESQGESQEMFRNELEERFYPVFNTLSEFLNFFASRHYGKSVDQIFITGESADLPYLEELFEKNMDIQAKVGFPKDWKPSFGKHSKKSENYWMKYGSLYGLAIRED